MKKKFFYQVSLTLAALFLLLMPVLALAENSTDIQQQIIEKQTEIENLKKQIATYQNNIRQKQAESASLRNQLNILENQIAKTELDIKASNAEISKIQLETRGVELDIVDKENKIDLKKHNLSNILQEINENDQENPIQVFLLNDSLSDYFSQVEYTKDLQTTLSQNLSEVKDEKKVLLNQKQDLLQKREALDKLKEDLESQMTELDGEQLYKKNILVQTKNSEEKFTALYWQAKQEQAAADAEITALEKKAREQLKDKPALTDSNLTWPVPENTITTLFHDPDYPFRYLFEHPAVDIRAKQGTPIKAPAPGYILTIKDNGMGYSYLAIIHADGLSTVYGHVSKFFVKEGEYVSRGETVALTGGMPGTSGAGNLTTGPHLHFEVRLNGIPVNPLDYLP